jgi:hypothetical protein
MSGDRKLVPVNAPTGLKVLAGPKLATPGTSGNDKVLELLSARLNIPFCGDPCGKLRMPLTYGILPVPV